MARSKRPPERVAGTYAAIPHAVMDSLAWQGASDRAIRLLMELLRQLNGGNNGRLQLTVSWLKSRGWKSADARQRAIAELVARGLIVLTRRGGLGVGADLYAVTWLAITNFRDLDLTAKDFHPGGWRFCEAASVARRAPPKRGDDEKACSDHRNSNVPTTGTGIAPPVPTTGTVEGVYGAFPVPTTGNNVLPLPHELSATGQDALGGPGRGARAARRFSL